MFFGFLTALISIAGGVLMVMLIMRGINRAQEIRQQTYLKTLQSGVYDYRLLEGRKSAGTGTLGWGIFFAAIGLALFISFIFLGIISEAMPGALIPLFIGLGLILYYIVRRALVGDVKQNGEPVKFTPQESGPESMKVVSDD